MKFRSLLGSNANTSRVIVTTHFDFGRREFLWLRQAVLALRFDGFAEGRQFLIESITLSLVGGIIGVLLGIGVAIVIPKLLSWPTLVSPASIVGSVIFSMLVGVIFGYYPARKAAALDPIDALRYE